MRSVALCALLAMFVMVLAPGAVALQYVPTSQLMATSFSNQYYAVDTGTGAVNSPITIMPTSAGVFAVGGMAQTSDHTIYLLNDPGYTASLYTFDTDSHEATAVGALGLTSIYEGDLTANPADDMLFAAYQFVSGAGVRLMTIDPLTGNGAMLPSTFASPDSDVNGLAFSPSGVLYALDSGGTANSVLYTIDPATGAATASLTLDMDLGVDGGMAFDPDTGTLYVASYMDATSENMLYTLDLDTGHLTAIGSMNLPGNGARIGSLTFITSATPEPATLSLLFALPAWVLRRRRRGA